MESTSPSRIESNQITTTTPQNRPAGTPADYPPMAAISNDCMRDHWLDLLAPRPFLRWRTTQVIAMQKTVGGVWLGCLPSGTARPTHLHTI